MSSTGSIRRILMTGSNGFVGRRLARALAATYPGVVIDDLGGPGQSGNIAAGPDVLDAVRRRPDLVIHLAARSSVAQSSTAGFDTVEVNTGGALRLAAALRTECPGVPLIFASSGEVYGASFREGVALTEAAPLQPGNAYARSKVASEHILRDALADVSPVTALRLFNHTGRGQDDRFVVPSFASQIARIEAGLSPPVIKVGNLDAARDFMHVDDVIDGYLAVIRALEPGKPGWLVYNVASGHAVQIRAVLEALIAMSPAAVTVEVDPDRLRPSDIPVACGNPGAFMDRFGWAPSRTLEATLSDVMDGARAAVRG